MYLGITEEEFKNVYGNFNIKVALFLGLDDSKNKTVEKSNPEIYKLLKKAKKEYKNWWVLSNQEPLDKELVSRAINKRNKSFNELENAIKN